MVFETTAAWTLFSTSGAVFKIVVETGACNFKRYFHFRIVSTRNLSFFSFHKMKEFDRFFKMLFYFDRILYYSIIFLFEEETNAFLKQIRK